MPSSQAAPRTVLGNFGLDTPDWVVDAPPNVQRRRLLLLFTCWASALLAWKPAVSGTQPQTEAWQVAAATVNASNGDALFLLAAHAERDGDLAAAERAYREAWFDPAHRERATAALWRLHESSRGELPRVDEGAVSQTLSELGGRATRHETRHFVVLSDTDLTWTAERAAMLERTRHQYYRSMRRLGMSLPPPERKLLCVLLNDQARFAEFAREHDGVHASWIAAYYSVRSNRIVLFNDTVPLEAPNPGLVAGSSVATLPAAPTPSSLQIAADEARRNARDHARYAEHLARYATAKAVHEAVHLLAFNTGLQSRSVEYPFWLTEGLAMSFETDDTNVSFGPDFTWAPRQARADELRRIGAIAPLRELVAMTNVPHDHSDHIEHIYLQSYDLFGHLFRYRRQNLAAYIQACTESPHLTRTPAGRIALFERHFGDIDALEQRLAAAR